MAGGRKQTAGTPVGTKIYVIGGTTAIDLAYGNDTLPVHTVTVSLVNDALEREVARSLNMLPTADEIVAFREHAFSTSRAPEILQRVRDHFGPDTNAFRRLYLEPRIVAGKLVALQRYDSTIQRPARDRIERAFALISAGNSSAISHSRSSTSASG